MPTWTILPASRTKRRRSGKRCQNSDAAKSQEGRSRRTKVECHLNADLRTARLDDDVNRNWPAGEDTKSLLKFSRCPA